MLRSNEAERRYDSDRGLEDDSGALRMTVAASLRTTAAAGLGSTDGAASDYGVD
jgi:hypothetical protein